MLNYTGSRGQTFSEVIQGLHYPVSKVGKKPAFGILGRLMALGYWLGLRFTQSRSWQRLHHAQAWPVPVVSIGNLTTGGTGKTPVTRAMAQFLEQHGLTPVVLSRGYKAKAKSVASGERVVHPDQGDEPFMLASALKKGSVRVGKNRFESAKKALEEDKADVLLLDDGYQNIAFPRTLNVLLVDGTLGFGNGYLLPAGPLREPPSAIDRADVVLLTKTISASVREEVVKSCEATGRAIPVYDCPFELELIHVFPESQASSEACSELLIVCGIAHPATFCRSIQAQFPKASLVSRVYPDHHGYTLSDSHRLQRDLKTRPQSVLVTTQKDWVKLSQFDGWPLDRVRVFETQAVCDWETVLAPVLEGLRVSEACSTP